MRIRSRSMFPCLALCATLTCCLVFQGRSSYGQATRAADAPAKASLPASAEQALADADRASMAALQAVERQWREVMRQARSRDRLKGFVGEAIGFFEKLNQVKDRAVNPAATSVRIKELFRARVLDEETVVRLLEKSLRDFCETLDTHDQALLIKMKIDRAATRTTLSRSVIDPASFKRPIHAAAAAAVEAVENDLSRSIASAIASEAIGMGVKQAARDLGIIRSEEGSFADFLGGLVIDIGIGLAVDAATDPTDGMVAHLEGQLMQAEQAILEGTATSPGFLTTLRRVAKERSEARRKIVRSELSN